MLRRTVNNQLSEAKGKIDALGDTLLGLWNVVVDAGDIASTALPTSYLVDAIYEGVTGEERPSLLERNDLARGAVDGATNAVNYVGDTVTGNKSWEQIKSDAKSFGQGLYDDYIDPFAKDAQYDQDNLFKGGLWTRSEEQSYEKGQNEFKKDMVVAEVAVSALSAGTGTAVMRTVKLADKLDGPGGRKGLDGGGGKGIGGLLLNSVDDMMDGGASIFDGKMKTSAKTPGDKQAEIQALVEKLQMKMKEQSNKEVDDRLDGGKGHTGSRAPETQTRHAEKSLDIPNKNVLPKVVNGDSGYSNYSPSMNSKANSTNKNNSQGSNKPDTEARTGHAQHAEKPQDIPDKKDLPKVVNGDFGNSNNSTPPKGKGDSTEKNDPQGNNKPDTEGTGKAGSVNRVFREATEEDKKLIDDVRKRFNAGKTKNVALTKGEIDGESINLESMSGYDPNNPNHKDNYPRPPENHYKYSGSDNKGRLQDTEQKMIEYLRERFKNNPDVEGSIEIISHNPICKSCNDIIDQFQIDFPNIKVTRVQILDDLN
ncbi:deaminase domain-containing protein [Brevibacillus sp. IT-7CA2]|uniref:deaminase domain-containing protein n=1 Tax=Brevibacillus sp. IT-7CA2 TaxID=3026436 RepID=UPI0039E0703E